MIRHKIHYKCIGERTSWKPDSVAAHRSSKRIHSEHLPIMSTCYAGDRVGIRHSRSPAQRLLDPSSELEVLKCIVLRESYLERVSRLAEDIERKKQRSRGQIQTLPAGLVDLLDLLRMSTLDTVEAISIWRLSQVDPTTTTFLWNGQNYMIKMLHDCDVLDRVEALHRWLGFRIFRNPFFVPPNSSEGKGGEGEPQIDERLKHCYLDKSGTVEIGRRPWLGPIQIPGGQDRTVGETKPRNKTTKTRKGTRDIRGSLSAYSAAIINDPTFLRNANQKAKGTATADIPLESPLTRVINFEGVVPNHVSREDYLRIRTAEQELADEEKRVAAPVATPTGMGAGIEYKSIKVASGLTGMEGLHVPHTSQSNGRGEAPSQGAYDEQRANCRERSVLRLKSRPKSTGDCGVSGSGSGNIVSLTNTVAGLLQCPHPQPHPGLGPILVQSDHHGADGGHQVFVHTVSTQLLEHTLQEGRDNSFSTMPDVDPIEDDRAVLCDDRQSAVVDDKGASPHNISNSSPLRARARSAPEPAIHGDAISPAEDGQSAATSRFRQQLEPSRHLEQKLAYRASKKAGADLMALTAAGTTGRRMPPPREARLRRLARDVARHSSELRELKATEARLQKNLVLLERGASEEDGDKCVRGIDREEGSAYSEYAFGSTNMHRGNANCAREDVEGSTDGRNIQGASGVGHARKTAFGISESSEIQHRQAIGLGDARSPESGTASEANEIARTIRHARAVLERKRHEMELKAFDLDIKRDELAYLRSIQKQERKRKRGLDLERRRMQLADGEILPEDDAIAETLEDCSALLVQKTHRGNLGRRYAEWYKVTIHEAAMTIQRGVRYIWDRRETARRLLLYRSARPIQATVRMFLARNRYKRQLQRAKELRACQKLQKVCRGMRGRRRAAARRTMILAAERAADWVSLDKLEPSDLTALANSIHTALVDPVHPLPPPGVLGIFRAAMITLGESCSSNGEGETEEDKVTFRTALGHTVCGAISAADLTWEMAARVLARPFRLLRRMRAFASGLGARSDSTPTRLLRLPPRALQLFAAYRAHPEWSEDVLMECSAGGKTAIAFVGWARELERVYQEQSRLEDFLRDAQPSWLRRNRSLQKRRRLLEVNYESCCAAVTAARERRDAREKQGLAYGDPVVAIERLVDRSRQAEDELRELETRRKAFLERQAEAEEATSRSLLGDVEFAEREASVAARAECMAGRIGHGGPLALAKLKTKRLDCEVILREMKRRLRVWERRHTEENQQLLEEWVPPTPEQVLMARSLGGARAELEVLLAQKSRTINQVGGSRFVKGLKGKALETWNLVSEGLLACREDILSGEERLAEDMCRFEVNLRVLYEDVSANKVCTSLWDNATEETKILEQEEDKEAAEAERLTVMGASLPSGFLNDTCATTGGEHQLYGPSRRPTVVLLGLDLPAAVRADIRAKIDSHAPRMFGLHLTGADALPSIVTAAPSMPCGFLQPSPEIISTPVPTYLDIQYTGDRSTLTSTHPSWRTEAGDGSEPLAARTACVGNECPSDRRARRIQEVLFAGQGVTVDVLPGPGLWARGRFLRDLETLVGGVDGCGGYQNDDRQHGARRKNARPAVVLVRGHLGNRSGGGVTLGYGTTEAAARKDLAENGQSKASFGATGADSVVCARTATAATRRAKVHLERSAQCLHDLSVTHGSHGNPFLHSDALNLPISEVEATSSGATNDQGTQRSSIPSPSSSVNGSRCLEILLAACNILLHPQSSNALISAYLDETGQELAKGHELGGGMLARVGTEPRADYDEAGAWSHIVGLARLCLDQLGSVGSLAREIADVLRHANLTSVPVEAAVVLRKFTQHKAWLGVSPRPRITGRCVLDTLSAWVVSAVSAAVEISLYGGGSEVACSGSGEDGGTVHCQPNLERQLVFSATKNESLQNSRGRELASLDKMEASLVDTEITVVDDDSPWVASESGSEEREREYQKLSCCSSEAFNTLLRAVLKPFQVYEDERSIPDDEPIASGRTEPEMVCAPSCMGEALPGKPVFSVTVSRAFGSVYVQAIPVNAGISGSREIAQARMRDDDLVQLLSPNWMEKHDLLALRELRDPPGVWKAVVDTLIFRNPSLSAHPRTSASLTEPAVCPYACDSSGEWTPTTRRDVHEATNARRGLRSSIAVRATACATGDLSFCHPRRKTLETSCLLMGHVMPVTVYEERRSDFWCEVHVPSTMNTTRSDVTVGLRVAKERIPLLLLDEDDPLHMRTILNAADMQTLSSLIADRISLQRTANFATRGLLPAARSWLDTAPGAGESGVPALNISGAGGSVGCVSGGSYYRLSLRKRRVGQVLFCRLVSFWLPIQALNRQVIESPNASESMDQTKADRMMQRQQSEVQKLVTITEIAHRGACGELRVDVREPCVYGPGEAVTLPSEVSQMLLAKRPARRYTSSLGELVRDRWSIAQYWSEAITWRLRLNPLRPVSYTTAGDTNGSTASTSGPNHKDVASAGRDKASTRIHVDPRESIFVLRRIAASENEGKHRCRRQESTTIVPRRRDIFDLMLLPVQGSHADGTSTTLLDIVFRHRTTAATFSFRLAPKAVVRAVSDTVHACLVGPTALLTELNQPASDYLQCLVGQWLSYSAPDEDSTHVGNLTLSIPGSKPIQAGPYVALRGHGSRQRVPTSQNSTVSRIRRREQVESHDTKLSGLANTRTLHQTSRPSCRAESKPSLRKSGVEDPHLHAEVGKSSKPLRTSISRLPTDTRNERLVFKRTLSVPVCWDSEGAAGEESGREEQQRSRKKTQPRANREQIAVCVYETFTARSNGRVVRSLKFCARDNTHPALSTSTIVPWTGSCPGVDGGQLLRVAEEGLRLRRITSREGDIVDILLQVTVPQRREGEDRRAHSESVERFEEGGSRVEGASNVHRVGLGQLPSNGALSTRSSPFEPTQNVPSAIKQENVTTEKLYEGWHIITGIRFHVQCFQEALSHGTSSHQVTRWMRPAGRGGVVEIPRGATLRFRLWNSVGGPRHETRISVDDLRASSSEEPRVDATLLEAGQRSALARAIVDHLRLVFKEDGGYDVVVPLLTTPKRY